MSRRSAKNIKLKQDEPPVSCIKEEEVEEQPDVRGYEMESATRSLSPAEPPIVSTSP